VDRYGGIETDACREAAARIESRCAVTGVIGLGYVGLPIAAASARAGFRTIGFDIDPGKVCRLNAGESYVGAVASRDLAGLVAGGKFRASGDFAELASCDVILICVPTPLSKSREPDLGFVVQTAHTVARHLRRGQLVVLESTTWPGTTEEVLKPLLQASGLDSGRDFFLAFSPEREDPGNDRFRTADIPKVMAGDGLEASALAEAFYAAVVERVVVCSSTAVAEAVKITENVFRAVNIALVNELKLVYDAMGIDVWEVIEAASTKPFGFMPFHPGPGSGGHCIPVDPHYLAWKARAFGARTRFIELAGEINASMPHYVIRRLEQALDARHGKALAASSVLVVGLAYKKNVSDIRESPALGLLGLLREKGAGIAYFDPHIGELPMTREHAALAGLRSTRLTPEAVAGFDAVLIATDHDDVDYGLILTHAPLIVDTRNAFGRRGHRDAKIVKA